MGRVAVNSIYLTVEKGAHNLFGLLLVVGVARLLGEEGLGDYAYVMSLTALFVPLLDMGLNNRVIKAVASRGPGARAAASDAVALKLALAPPVLVVMGAAAWFSGKSAILAAVLLVGASTVAMSLGDALNAIFKGLQRPIYSALLVGGLNALIFVSALGAVGAGLGLAGLGACYFLCRSGFLGAGLGLVGRVAPNLRPAFKPAIRRDLIVHGLWYLPAPYFLGNLLNLSYMTTYFAVGEAESGQFAIGYKLATALFILASANLEAILPALTCRFQDAESLRGMLLRTLGALLGITLLGVMAVQAVAPVTVWVFGAAFTPAVSAVRLLAWTLPPLALCGLAHTALLAVDRQKSGALIMLALVIVGTASGIVAARFWGPVGTALAPTVTGCLFAIALWTMVWRETGRPQERISE